MNADGSGRTQLTKISGEYISGGSQLVWSPDRTKIAFLFGAYPDRKITQSMPMEPHQKFDKQP